MTLLVLLAISIVVASAVYLSLSRDLFRVVIGLTMLGAAINLVVFAAGRFATLTPPLLATAEDAQAAAVANPLVQALVLTAIVIGVAVQAFMMTLVLRVYRAYRTLDIRELRTCIERDLAREAGIPLPTSEDAPLTPLVNEPGVGGGGP